MAALKISVAEIVAFIYARKVELPSKIEKIEAADDKFKITVNAGRFVPSFDVFLKFSSFEAGVAVFKMQTKAGLLSKILGQLFKEVSLADAVVMRQAELIEVRIDQLLAKKWDFLEITSISEEAGVFTLDFAFRDSKNSG